MTVCLTVRVLEGRVLSVEPERFEVKLTTASDKLADRDSEWEELYCGREVLHPLTTRRVFSSFLEIYSVVSLQVSFSKLFEGTPSAQEFFSAYFCLASVYTRVQCPFFQVWVPCPKP